jgi:hypothetical protein
MATYPMPNSCNSGPGNYHPTYDLTAVNQHNDFYPVPPPPATEEVGSPVGARDDDYADLSTEEAAATEQTGNEEVNILSDGATVADKTAAEEALGPHGPSPKQRRPLILDPDDDDWQLSPDIAEVVPAVLLDAIALTDAEQAELDAAVASFRAHLCSAAEHRIACGHALKVINRLWTKIGKSFKQYVRPEFGIAYTTGLDWMRAATDADSGTGPVLPAEPEAPDYPDDAGEPDGVGDAIAAARRRVAAIRQSNQHPSTLMTFRPRIEGLTRQEYAALEVLYKAMSHEERKRRYLAAMEVPDAVATA